MALNFEPANLGGVNSGSDPEWEAILEQINQEQETQQAEWEQFHTQAQIETEQARQSVQSITAQREQTARRIAGKLGIAVAAPRGGA